jgi:hypothetical protein
MEKLVLCTLCRGSKVNVGMGGMDVKCTKCNGVGMVMMKTMDRPKDVAISIKQRKFNRFKRNVKLPNDSDNASLAECSKNV